MGFMGYLQKAKRAQSDSAQDAGRVAAPRTRASPASAGDINVNLGTIADGGKPDAAWCPKCASNAGRTGIDISRRPRTNSQILRGAAAEQFRAFAVTSTETTDGGSGGRRRARPASASCEVKTKA
jgi:hypothetical protein